MYDPYTGRFLQQDSLEDFFPGESPYSYAYHNPVMFNDPTGLASGEIVSKTTIFNSHHPVRLRRPPLLGEEGKLIGIIC